MWRMTSAMQALVRVLEGLSDKQLAYEYLGIIKFNKINEIKNILHVVDL